MAGRGRGMTLPAWMTQGTGVEAVLKPEKSATPAPAPAPAPAAVTTAAAVTTPHTAAGNPGDDPNNWSTHTAPDGRPYYYNRILNISTYDQPNCLKTAAQPTPHAAATECKWREYFAPDGRPYYSDGKESRWDMPEEFRLWKERNPAAQPQPQPIAVQAPPVQAAPVYQQPIPLQQQPASMMPQPVRFSLDQKHEPMRPAMQARPAPQAAPAVAEPVRVVVQSRQQQQPQSQAKPEGDSTSDKKGSQPGYASEAEAMEAFKAMLAEHKISSTMKWKDVENQLSGQDPRWDALRTNGQKRQALAEYQNAKAKEEKQLQRQRARKARDNFLKMLAENTEIDHRTTWREAARILGDEPRFKAVEDEHEREEIYNDFVFELAKKEKQDREAAVSSALDVFREMLRNDPNVTHRTVWADFKATFTGFEDARLAPLGEQEMRRALQDHVLELDRQQKAAERAEREAKEREERLHRDALRSALLSMVEEDKLSPKTTWSEAQQQLSDFEALRALDEKAAFQEFDRVMHELERQLRTDIRNTRDAVRQFKLPLESSTTFEDFLSSVRAWEPKLEQMEVQDEREHSLLVKEYAALKALATERAKNLRLAFEEIKAEVLRDEEERAKKQAKRERRFKALLEDFYYRSDHIGISWDEAKRELAEEREYRELDRADRKRLFYEHMEELAAKMASTKALKDSLAAEEHKRSHDEHGPDNGEGRRARSVSRSRSGSRSRSDSRSSRSRSRSDSRGRSRSRSRADSREEKVKRAKRGDLEVEAGQVEDESEGEHDEERSYRREKDKRKKSKKHKHEKKSKKHKRNKRSVSSDRSESRKRSRRSVSRS